MEVQLYPESSSRNLYLVAPFVDLVVLEHRDAFVMNLYEICSKLSRFAVQKLLFVCNSARDALKDQELEN